MYNTLTKVLKDYVTTANDYFKKLFLVVASRAFKWLLQFGMFLSRYVVMMLNFYPISSFPTYYKLTLSLLTNSGLHYALVHEAFTNLC